MPQFDDWIAEIKRGEVREYPDDASARSQMRVNGIARTGRDSMLNERPAELFPAALVAHAMVDGPATRLCLRTADDPNAADSQAVELFIDAPSLDFLIWQLEQAREYIKSRF